MSNQIRRKRGSRDNIGPYKRHELLTGKIYYPVRGYTGYGDGISTDVANFVSEDMRLDWDANRDELTAFWLSGEDTHADIFPDSLPWLWARGDGKTLPWAAVHLDGR